MTRTPYSRCRGKLSRLPARWKAGRLRWAPLSVLPSMRPPVEAPRLYAPPNSVLMVVSFLRWALFLIADCLANVRDEMIYELTFPGGNRGARRWCRHTVRPDSLRQLDRQSALSLGGAKNTG